MSLTVNAKTYTADSFQKDSVGYIGTGKTVTVKDDVKLARVAPKPSSVFSGVGRCQFKLTRTLTLTDALTPQGDLIVDVNVSVPVGCDSADVDAALDDMGAAVAAASISALANNQQIAF